MIEEKYLRYNRELVNRFISDYKLPITMNKEKYFFYFIELYEDKFKSLTKWKALWDMIDTHFSGDEKKFLDEYYNVRENIIQTISNSNSYKEFNAIDLNKYSIIDKPNVTSNNVYNGENINKSFLSIDLKKANFQAINFVDRNILLNSNTYEDFIKKFTDSEYIKNSKYFRSVVFGKMNPKRHITIEKYLINEVWKVYKKNFPHDSCICSLSNDDIVINTCMSKESKLILAGRCADIKRFIKEELGLEVSVEYYFLEGYQLFSKESGNPRNTFYAKTNIINNDMELVCVSAPYYALTYKLFNNIPLEEPDYHFIYEGIDCRFMEEFGLRKL